MAKGPRPGIHSVIITRVSDHVVPAMTAPNGIAPKPNGAVSKALTVLMPVRVTSPAVINGVACPTWKIAQVSPCCAVTDAPVEFPKFSITNLYFPNWKLLIHGEVSAKSFSSDNCWLKLGVVYIWYKSCYRAACEGYGHAARMKYGLYGRNGQVGNLFLHPPVGSYWIKWHMALMQEKNLVLVHKPNDLVRRWV